MCFYSHFLFQYTDLSNSLLRVFDSFLLSFLIKWQQGHGIFVSLIVKIISGFTLVLSLPTAAKS